MRLLRFFILPAVVLLASMSASFATTATTWRTFPEERRRAFVLGVVETWVNFVQNYDYAVSKHYVDPKKVSGIDNLFLSVGRCVMERNLSEDEIFRTVDEYVEQRPDRREYAIAGVTWNAITELCKK